MNIKFNAPCKFHIQGNCKKGEQCEYSHGTSQTEKVNLIRDEKGKLNLKRNNDYQQNNVKGRGRGRGTSERFNDEEQDQSNKKRDQSQKFDQQQRQQQSSNSYKQRDDKRFVEQQDGNENRQVKQKGNQNLYQQGDKKQLIQQTEKNNVNSDRWERHQNYNDEDNQKQYQQNNGSRGRGRGRGFRENTFPRKEFIQEEEEKERKSQIELQGENLDVLDVQKKVKKNEIQVKKRNQVLNLEQRINITNLIQIIGYNFQFFGILKSDSIDFYQILFNSQIMDEDKKVTIPHEDTQFISAFMQEHLNNQFTLIIQFQKDDESFKNLLIYHNVFNQQIPQIIYDISMKEIVYTNFEDELLYTFCKDGLIRIFKQNEFGQYKHVQHYDVEQSIESVIKVGTNYLIGMRNGSIYLFNGIIITEIPQKFTQKCTQMIIDFNRVILKLDDDYYTSIYILNQKLEIIGPIYEGEKVVCLELIKSYENDKLFIFGLRNSIEIYTELDNKLYPINVILNQRFKQLKKIEITNENMVTQKFIVGEYDGELRIFSVVPEL